MLTQGHVVFATVEYRTERTRRTSRRRRYGRQAAAEPPSRRQVGDADAGR